MKKTLVFLTIILPLLLLILPVTVNAEDTIYLQPYPRTVNPPVDHIEVTFDTLIVFEGDEVAITAEAFDVAPDVKFIYILFLTSDEEIDLLQAFDDLSHYKISKKSIKLSHDSVPPFQTSTTLQFIIANEDNWIQAAVSTEKRFNVMGESSKVFTVHPITEKPDDPYVIPVIVIVSASLILAGILKGIPWIVKSRKKSSITVQQPQSENDKFSPVEKSYHIEIPAGASERLDNPYVEPNKYVGKLEHSIIWQNNDDAVHSLISGRRKIISEDNDVAEGVPDGLFNIILKPHENFEFKFPKEGTYHYYCNIHKCTEATIVIK